MARTTCKIWIEAAFVHRVEKAVLVAREGEEFWLPLSRVECAELACVLEPGDIMQIGLPQWLAKEKGCA